MLKNCVFNTSVDTKKWLKASAIRAVMGDVNCVMVASASALSGIISILTSVAGIPEVRSDENE